MLRAIESLARRNISVIHIKRRKSLSSLLFIVAPPYTLQKLKCFVSRLQSVPRPLAVPARTFPSDTQNASPRKCHTPYYNPYTHIHQQCVLPPAPVSDHGDNLSNILFLCDFQS